MPQKYYVLCDSNGSRRYFCGYRNVVGGWHTSGDEKDALPVVLHKADRIVELHRKSYPCSHVQVVEVQTAKQKESRKVEELIAERDRLRAELAAEGRVRTQLRGELTAANGTIAGLRESARKVLDVPASYDDFGNMIVSAEDRNSFITALSDALSRTPDQHRARIEAGVLREAAVRLRKQDCSDEAVRTYEWLTDEAERLEKEAGNDKVLPQTTEECFRDLQQQIVQLEADLAEARKDRKALYDSMRDVCRIVGGMTNDGVSVDFLLHVPAEVEAKLAEAQRDGERMDKLEALKKPGQRWMIHDWTFHKDITAYVGVWHGESYPGKSHETLREAIDDAARKEEV